MISVERHDDGSDLATSQLERLMRDEMRCPDIFGQRNQVVHVNVVRHSYTIKQVTSRGKSSPRRIIHAFKTLAWPLSVASGNRISKISPKPSSLIVIESF